MRNLLLGLVLLAAAAPLARAEDELSRDDTFAAIVKLSEARRPAEIEQARLRELCESFLARFPEDEEAPAVRQRLGLTLVSLGEDERAVREFAAVTVTARPGGLRTATLYALGEALIRCGRAEEARPALEAVLAEAPESGLARSVRSDLRDLEKIGREAPSLAGPPAEGPFVLAFVWKSGPRPKDLPEGARVVEVSGWQDPIVATWRLPALPRFYVIDRAGKVRAAGVRGRAVRAALEAAR